MCGWIGGWVVVLVDGLESMGCWGYGGWWVVVESTETLTLPAAQLLCTEEADAPAQGQEVCKKMKKKRQRKKTYGKHEEEEDMSGEWEMVCKKQRKC